MGDELTRARVDTVDLLFGSINARLDGSPLVMMLDVDGTLAPIAPTPAEAGVPAATREILRRLVGQPNVVAALVSGRAVADAWKIAGVDGMWVIGNHGVEWRTPSGEISASAEAIEFEAVIERASELLRPLEQGARGTLIENKRWTLSVHFRLVSERETAQVIARAEEVARRLGLRTTRGKKIVELRPAIGVNKGTAAVEFAEQHGAFASHGSVLYAGDDRTDEDALRELRARSPRAVTVRIGGDDGDDDGDTETSAEFVLESPEQLRRVLEWLVTRRANLARGIARASAP